MDEKRQRGGQPGNSNALKTGFYSKKYSQLECDDLEAGLAEGLQDEIVLARVMMRRLLEKAEQVNTLDQMIVFANTVTNICTKISRLLRIQQLVGGGQSKEDVFSQALEEVIKELKLKE